MGADRTKIIFRYGLGEAGIRFFSPKPNATVGPNTPLELHAAPTGLQRMTIRIGDTLVSEWTRSTHSGNTFAFARTAARVMERLSDGPATLRGAAEYADGSERSVEVPIAVRRDHADATRPPTSQVAIDFRGEGHAG